MDMVSTLRDLRARQVRVRSLASSEQQWTRFFDADPDSPEAVSGMYWLILQSQIELKR